MIGIYKIENKVNGKVYIGESLDIERRWGEHIESLNNQMHDNWMLQQDWNTYGEDNFSFNTVKLIKSFKNQINCMCYLIILENYYIKKYGTYNIANTLNDVYTGKIDIFGKKNNSDYMLIPSTFHAKFLQIYNIFTLKKKFMSVGDDYVLGEDVINIGFSFPNFVTGNRELNNKKYKTYDILKKLLAKTKNTYAIKYKDVYSRNKINPEYEHLFKMIDNELYVSKQYFDIVKKSWLSENIVFEE